jgi:hypothetical protein
MINEVTETPTVLASFCQPSHIASSILMLLALATMVFTFPPRIYEKVYTITHGIYQSVFTIRFPNP